MTCLALNETDAADAFVQQGSPGPGNSGHDNIQVPDGQTYNLHADGDLVAWSGWHAGGDPANYLDVRGLETGAAEHPETRDPLIESRGHTEYTKADEERSTSEHNTAAVIAGKERLLIGDGD